jgi:co-chaperonin GroES (HSP10)
MIRPTQDNVLLLLDPDIPTETASGIAIVQFEKSKAYANRMGRVLAVGPGHEDKRGVFQPTQIKVGERVVVPVLAGDNYTYQKRQDFAEMYGLEGDNWELRMVREDEILGVIEDSEVREGAAAAE